VVTGAGGFVGGHPTRALASAGRTVLATDVGPALPGWVTAGLRGGQVRYAAGDLLENATLDAVLPGEAFSLVHVAALTRFHGEAAPTPEQALHAFAVNAGVPWRLCAWAAERGRIRRLVHVSTRSVFGRLPARTEPIAEGTAYAPAGVYGHSKAAGEVGVLSLREEFGLDAVLARITGVFGAWQGPRSPVARILEAAATGRPLHSDTGAAQSSEMTYVKDTVRGIVTLLQADRLPSPVYHVSSGRMSTLGEVAAAARAVVPGADIKIGAGEDPGAWRRTPLDVGRIEREVGFRARWTLADAIADAVRAERTGAYGPEALED
jgi:UDP-glucose 4-epimerase